MSQIVLYFQYSTSVLSFYIDMVLMLSICKLCQFVFIIELYNNWPCYSKTQCIPIDQDLFMSELHTSLHKFPRSICRGWLSNGTYTGKIYNILCNNLQKDGNISLCTRHILNRTVGRQWPCLSVDYPHKWPVMWKGPQWCNQRGHLKITGFVVDIFKMGFSNHMGCTGNMIVKTTARQMCIPLENIA